jgi:hypothetical protein
MMSEKIRSSMKRIDKLIFELLINFLENISSYESVEKIKV